MPEKKLAYHLSFGDVIRVMRLVDESPFRELYFELGDLKLHVVQDAKDGAPAPAAKAPPPAAPQAAARAREAERAASPGTRPPQALDGTPVIAPLAGTFYRSPFPGEPPFVEEGAAVKEGDVVGILEIMKLMNHVAAPCSGVLSKFCVSNEQFVEFGQVLAVIKPA